MRINQSSRCGKPEAAALAIVIFDFYANDALGNAPRARLDPRVFFKTNAILDSTVVGLIGIARAGLLVEQKIQPVLQSVVTIYQHPGGEHMHESTQLVCEVTPNTLRYKCDTLPGSSGSPIFNHSMQLIGIHCSGYRDRQFNEGIRIDRIIEWLERLSPELPLQLGALPVRMGAPLLSAPTPVPSTTPAPPPPPRDHATLPLAPFSLTTERPAPLVPNSLFISPWQPSAPTTIPPAIAVEEPWIILETSPPLLPRPLPDRPATPWRANVECRRVGATVQLRGKVDVPVQFAMNWRLCVLPPNCRPAQYQRIIMHCNPHFGIIYEWLYISANGEVTFNAQPRVPGLNWIYCTLKTGDAPFVQFA